MHGPAHLIISWFTAETADIDSPRERRLIALCGFAPDLDVLAYLGAMVYFGFDKDRAFEQVWQQVHHRYTHGLGFVLLTGLLVFMLMRRRATSSVGGMRYAARVAGLSMLVSIIHLFGDLVAGGADWPIYPLWPLSDLAWSMSGSWALGDWPNALILLLCLAGTLVYARAAGYSPLESVHYGLDRACVTILRNGRLDFRGDPETATGGNRRGLRIRLTVYGLLLLLILAILLPLGYHPGLDN